MSNVVNDYGWNTSTGPESCGYIAPKVMSILRELGAHRICDLGSGNGALVAAIKAAGFYAVGVEYDKQGVDLSIKPILTFTFITWVFKITPHLF